MYNPLLRLLTVFAEPVCRWVRFGKRTHRRGVFEGAKAKMRETKPVLGAGKGARTLPLWGYERMESLRCWLLEGVLVSWEMVAANNSGVSSDSARQAQHDRSEVVDNNRMEATANGRLRQPSLPLMGTGVFLRRDSFRILRMKLAG